MPPTKRMRVMMKKIAKEMKRLRRLGGGEEVDMMYIKDHVTLSVAKSL